MYTLRFFLTGAVLSFLACSEKSTEPAGDVVSPLGIVEYVDSLSNDTLRTATLNMTIGFPVTQLAFLDLDNDSIVYTQTNELLDQYLKSQPHERVKMMAAEIVSLDLDVIGLQEVLTMRISDTVHADFLPLLLEELERLSGIAYQSHFTRLNEFEIGPYVYEADTLEVVFAEGNALLVKPEYTVSDRSVITFSDNVEVTFLGEDVESVRNAVVMELQSPGGKKYQVFSTHIEVEGPFGAWRRTQKVQITDLLFLIDSMYVEGSAQIILGDMNVTPDAELYGQFSGKNWVDSHLELGMGGAGTCCVADLRAAGSDFSNKRIDYVMGRGITKVIAGDIGLDKALSTSSGDTVFAADHRLVTSVFECQY